MTPSNPELTPRETSALTLTREQIQLLKDTIFKGGTDEELRFFIEVCKYLNLNPFLRQIYPIKRWDATLRREVMTFQTGIDGFRAKAERTGKYLGQKEPQWCGSDGKWRDVWLERIPPMAAKVAVIRAGWQEPIVAVALYSEYVQLAKEGGANSMWRKMPANQLEKCAEAKALRKAFPEELSGLYTDDEMEQADNPSPPIVAGRNGRADDAIETLDDPLDESPTPPSEPEPHSSSQDTLKQILAGFSTIKNIDEAFEQMKEAFLRFYPGEEYEQILAEHGATPGNRTKNGCRAAFTALWNKYHAALERQAKAEAPPEGQES